MKQEHLVLQSKKLKNVSDTLKQSTLTREQLAVIGNEINNLIINYNEANRKLDRSGK